jgi:plasmid stabilization system protein ParE
MDFKVIFKDTFVADLEQIVRGIAHHDPDAAQRFGEIVIRMAESLHFFPERFPRLHQRLGVRRFIVHKYFKVFYRIHGDTKTVEILRCWDGRRESDPVLGKH